MSEFSGNKNSILEHVSFLKQLKQISAVYIFTDNGKFITSFLSIYVHKILQNRLYKLLGKKNKDDKNNFYLYWGPKLKLQAVLSFSSFVHNSSINEHKKMKLREYICFEIFN